MQNLSHLPKSAQNLIALVGVPSTLRLVDQFGGIALRLYGADLDLVVQTVGQESAQKMLNFYADTPFTVPLCRDALRVLRNEEIIKEFDRLTMEEKLSARAAVVQITRRFTPHIHERTIWRVLKTLPGVKEENDQRQMSLI